MALGAERHLAWRLAAALSCLLLSKAVNIACPMCLREAVNALAAGTTSTALLAVGAFGALQVLGAGAKEVQNPVFTPISQAAARRLAYNTVRLFGRVACKLLCRA
jgi:hypothetical protein